MSPPRPRAWFNLTIRRNCIVVVSDGRAGLGLGNIGAAAATVGDEELSPDYIVPSPGAAALPVRIALPVSGRIMVRVA